MTAFPRALLCVAAASMMLAAAPARTQAFPTKPIRLIVPFPPGGVDVTIRLMQNHMSEDLGQPVILENRGGANGFIGSAQHLDGETFKMVAGTDIVHIPYKGGGPQAQGLVAGEIDVSFQPLQQLRPFMSGGKIRILAYYNGPRPPDLASTPDLANAVPGFRAGPGFIGLLGPARLPAPVLARLNAAAVKAITAPETRAKMEANGAIIVAGTPEAFAADLKAGLDGTRKYVEAITARGVKFE